VRLIADIAAKTNLLALFVIMPLYIKPLA
jgi:hypothetical protein